MISRLLLATFYLYHMMGQDLRPTCQTHCVDISYFPDFPLRLLHPTYAFKYICFKLSRARDDSRHLFVNHTITRKMYRDRLWEWVCECIFECQRVWRVVLHQSSPSKFRSCLNIPTNPSTYSLSYFWKIVCLRVLLLQPCCTLRLRILPMRFMLVSSRTGSSQACQPKPCMYPFVLLHW